MTDLSSFANAIVSRVSNPDTRELNHYSYDYVRDDPSGGIVVYDGDEPLGELNAPAPVDLGSKSYRENGFPLVGAVGPLSKTFVRTDCSGFITYAIQEVAPELFPQLVSVVRRLRIAHADLQQLDRKHNQPWPSAADFAYLQYGSLPTGVSVVATQTTLANILSDQSAPAAGDILAWDNPGGGTQGRTIADTGHVMILQSSLRPDADLAETYTLRVCDCSGPHINDTRTEPGVGLGTIIVKQMSSGWSFNFTQDPAKAFVPLHFTFLRLTSTLT